MRSHSALPPLMSKEPRVGGEGISTSAARSPAFPRAAWRRVFSGSHSALPLLISKELRVGGEGTLDELRAPAGVPRVEEVLLGLT